MKPNTKTQCVVRQGSQAKNVAISKEHSLLDELRAHKFAIPFSCGGEGICTTCRVILISGKLTDRSPLEQKCADERSYNEDERLSCQCLALSDSIEIKIPS